MSLIFVTLSFPVFVDLHGTIGPDNCDTIEKQKSIENSNCLHKAYELQSYFCPDYLGASWIHTKSPIFILANNCHFHTRYIHSVNS